MNRPLNGCMCQNGSCEACNRVIDAFEAMREALCQSDNSMTFVLGRIGVCASWLPAGEAKLLLADVLSTLQTDRDLFARSALALADEAAKWKPGAPPGRKRA